MQNAAETKSFFIQVIAAALRGEGAAPLPPDANCKLLARLASRNAVQGLFCRGLGENLQSFPEELREKLQKSCWAAAVRESAQQDLLSAIRESFSASDIDFILLKGSHLKALYPAPELRFMVDTDVLVHEDDIPKAKEILSGFGLALKFDNGKDIVFIKEPFLTVELHRSLFQEENVMYAHFCDAWQTAVAGDVPHEYKMTDNDLYVYTLAHLAEHYLEAGSCFRPVMDLYLLETKQNLDFDLIRAQLNTLGLVKFGENIRALGKAMFSGAPYNDTLTLMENYITLGPPVQNAAGAAIAASSKQSRAARLLRTAFPPYSRMLLRYPALKKAPFLLPIFWAWRLLRYAFSKDERIRKKRNRLSKENPKSTDILQKIFEKSGL